MQEEVFGPILPVLDYKDFNEVINIIQNHEKPLSAYIFTNNHAEKEAFISKISFGGGCVNDTVMHISNPNLPFGGIGNSGIGSYHGKFGFEAFSHRKSVIDKATWGEPDLRYPPIPIPRRSGSDDCRGMSIDPRHRNLKTAYLTKVRGLDGS